MTVDLWMPYMLMLVVMTLTQGHSGSAMANNRCMLSASKQATSIKLATTVCHFLCDLDLDYANVYMACLSCLKLPYELGKGEGSWLSVWVGLFGEGLKIYEGGNVNYDSHIIA